MALLGKISAVITANATDFTRTIGNMKSELNALQKRVQGYRLNLETTALDKTLTKLQLFRRTLQEAVGKRIDVGPLQDLYKAVEDIGKPLIQVKNQIEALSNSTQAYLYPALERAQKAFQNLFNDIKSGATTFDASRGRIDQLVRSIERLKASTAVVTEFSRASASLSTTSAGGTFVQPRALEELKRAMELRKKAAEMPAASREDPFFQNMVREAAVAADRIEALVAKIEKAKLRAALAESVIARDVAGGRVPAPAAISALASATADQARAQRQLDAETERQAARNVAFSGRISLQDVVDAGRPQQQASQVEAAAEKAKRAIDSLRAADPALEPYVQQLSQMAAELLKVADGSAAAAAALAKLDDSSGSGIRLAEATDALRRIDADSRRRVDSLTTPRERRQREFEEARAAGVSPDDVAGTQRRDFLASNVGGRIGGLQSELNSLSKGLSGDLESRLKASRTQLERLFNAKATPSISEMNKLSSEVRQLEKEMAAARKQQDLLGDFDSSTGMNLQPRAVKDYINDFQLLLNLAGTLNEEAGTKFAGSLQNSRAKVRSLAEEMAKVKLGPATTESAKEVDRILGEIRKESAALARELSMLDPTKFSQRSLDRMLSANRRLRGDFGGMRNSAMTFQLAMQQATFAVDDFFSSTGGMEYKLRAVSNNISQLGFILGGTAGLIAGVAATVATQLLIQFGGIGKASKESEGALKFLNDELEKSRNLAEENTKAFREMAKALETVAVSGPRGDIERQIRDLRDTQRQQREADVVSRSPEVAAAAGRTARLEEELSKASGSERVRIRRELEAARRDEEQARRRAVAPRTNRQAMLDAQAAMERARATEITALEARASFEGLSEFSRRPARLRRIQNERVALPTDTQDAVRQVEARIQELQGTQAGTPAMARLLASLPKALQGVLVPLLEDGDVQAAQQIIDSYSETEKVIEQLDAELGRLKGIIKRGADDLAAQFAEQALIANEEIKNSLGTLSSIGVDGDVRARIAGELDVQAKALADVSKRVEEALRNDPSANIDALRDEAGRAAAALESLYQQTDRLARDAALGAFVPTSRTIADAAAIAGEVGGPTQAGTYAARLEQNRLLAEAQRSRAELRNDAAGKAAADAEIARIRDTADSFLEASIAVRAFQRAAEEAGLALGRTLAGEARSEAEQLRRRANRLAGDPLLATGAAQARDSARRRQRQEEGAQRQLDAQAARARLEFERSPNAEVQRLAREVREGRRAERDLMLPVDQQLAGRDRANQAEAELDRLFERTRAAEDIRRKADERESRRAAEIERTRLANRPLIEGANVARGTQRSNVSMATGLGGDAVQQATALANALEEAQRKLEEAASIGVEPGEALKKELDRLANDIERQRQDFVIRTVGREQNRGAGFAAQTRAAQNELERAGVFASDLQGRMTEMQVQRDSLVAKRDQLIDQGRAAEAAAVQRQIDAMDALAQEVNAAAIAIAGFQEAANKAALSLQRTLESEARGAADSARRQANDTEAVFGAGSPQARAAREEQARRERQVEKATDERLQAEEEIANARVKFEEDIAAGRRGPAAKARAEEISQLEKDAQNQALSPAERERARLRGERLRREQEAEFSQDPDVQRQRRRADEADAEARQLDMAARGAELMKTERQKREEELATRAAEIGARVDQMRQAGVPRAQINAQAQNAANNLARDAAPMLAQFAEEVMSSRLAGPSRAALNVADAQTTEGAKELNRLIRGDDPAKDVNLVELRKQSQALQAIEDLLRRQGIIVEL